MQHLSAIDFLSLGVPMLGVIAATVWLFWPTREATPKPPPRLEEAEGDKNFKLE